MVHDRTKRIQDKMPCRQRQLPGLVTESPYFREAKLEPFRPRDTFRHEMEMPQSHSSAFVTTAWSGVAARGRAH